MVSEKYHKYILLLATIMLYLAYSNTFFSPPVLDDYHSFIDEPLIKHNSLSFDSLLMLTQSKFGICRWIPMMSFSIDLNLGNGSILNLHVTNLLIHVMTFLSVLFLIPKMAEHVRLHCPAKENLPPSSDLALWVAALWALNPVQTNAVTYLVQRMSSWAALFSVLCVALYFVGRSRSFTKKRVMNTESMMYFLGSLLCMLMGLLCKENSLILPILLLCTETWFFQPDLHKKFLDFLLRRQSLLALALIGVVLVVAIFLPGIVGGYGGRHFTLGQRLLTETRIVVWYVTLLLWPHPGRLSLEHDIDISTSLIHPISTLSSLGLLAGILFLIITQRRNYPLTTYGILWFLLNLLIESTIIPLELIFEHRLYFPSVGLILSVTIATYTLSSRFNTRLPSREFATLSWCIVALLCSALTLATFERNNVWKDYLTLNRDNVLKAPDNPRAHCNLAVALSKTGEFKEAIREAEIAIKLGQTYYESYCEASNTVIISLLGLQEYERAIREGKRLIKELPAEAKAGALPNIYLNMVLAYKATGDYRAGYTATIEGLMSNQHLSPRQPSVAEMGVRLLRLLLDHPPSEQIDLDGDGRPDPGDMPTDTWIAKLLDRFDYRAEAKSLLEQSITENPQDPTTRTLWQAAINEEEQNFAQAHNWSFSQKYVMRPFSTFNACMAMAYLVRENNLPAPFMKMGENFVDYALKIQPRSADALLLKGWYHYEKDETIEAVTRAKSAIYLEPDNAKAWLGLGFFLAKANHPKEAITAFQKTLELYPGYPQRVAILDISANLLRRQPPDELIPAESNIERSAQPPSNSSPPAST
jgi:protein O-mannosyl-transferase